MSDLIIIKLGGSVVTAKQSKRPVLRTRLLRRLASELSGWYSALPARKRTRLILLHGGGSFGHPLAHRYQLQKKTLSADSLAETGRTISAMRELGNCIAAAFLDAGIPVVPLQTSSFVQQKGGRVVFGNYALIETILAYGGVPLLGGDVIIADNKRTVIVSADTLAVELAAHFHARKLFFATNVDGVYERFPPRRGERPIPKVSRRKLRGMTVLKTRGSARDVTGAMAGKLRALSPLRNCEAVIFNALVPGTLRDVLNGKSRGTTVIL